jgi:hypothetical protein
MTKKMVWLLLFAFPTIAGAAPAELDQAYESYGGYASVGIAWRQHKRLSWARAAD